MGWFKSLAGIVAKPVAKLIDPLLPEGVKKTLNTLDIGGLAFGGAFAPQSSGGAAPAAAASTAPVVATLSDDELAAEAQKRLAKLGKYFTSPLGVLSQASTGSQRVFS